MEFDTYDSLHQWRSGVLIHSGIWVIPISSPLSSPLLSPLRISDRTPPPLAVQLESCIILLSSCIAWQQKVVKTIVITIWVFLDTQDWHVTIFSWMLTAAFYLVIYKVALKVSHSQESSLNHIKHRQWGYISHQFWFQNAHKNICLY